MTNTGNVDITSVVVTDNQGVVPVFQSGDDGDGILQTDETWIYTANGTAIAGAYTNLGGVTGDPLDPNGDPVGGPVDDEDPSNYFGEATPGIDIEKSTNGEDADTPTGPVLLVGDTANFEYVVNNTGDVALGSVTVSDDQGVSLTFQGGDSDGDGLLDTNETWTYTGSTTVTDGQYTNIGSVTGTPVDENGNPLVDPDGDPLPDTSDNDPSNHFGADPSIDIDKVTNGSDGLTIPAGSPITWTYTVTNTGNVDIANVVVTDDQGVVPVFQSGDDGDGILQTDETWIYTANGTAIAGAYENLGDVTGQPLDPNGDPVGGPVDDEDPSNYFGSDPDIDLDKVGSLDLGPDDIANPGDIITYTFTVTNTGNVTLNNVTLTDPLPGLSIGDLSDNGGDGVDVLAPQAVETATGTYAITQADIDAGLVFNEATVQGVQPPVGKCLWICHPRGPIPQENRPIHYNRQGNNRWLFNR